MSVELDKKCRTCLCDSHIFHQLYDYVDENYKVLEMLDGIVPQIAIRTTSQFSTLVCQTCVDKLLTGYKFQQLCIETNQRLHDLKGLTVCETANPKLDMLLDSLTEEASFKMKEEFIDDACFECEINPEDLEEEIITDNVWGPFQDNDYDTDSSNEKLSALKERKTKKSPLKCGEIKKSNKKNRRKGHFPCAECGKVFNCVYRLKRHAAVHEQLSAYCSEIVKCSYAAKKTNNAHMLTHKKEEIPNIEELEIDDQNESKEFNVGIGNNDSKEETDIVKELQTFKYPDCPKYFEEKASLSAHYKVHTKKPKSISNKSLKNEEILEGEEMGVHIENNQELEVTEMENAPKAMVKEEIEVTPQIYEEPIDVTDNNEECLNNDFDDSDDNSETKNFDFVDTNIADIEKANSSNKHSGTLPCEVCGKVFDCPQRLKQHSSVHSLVRPHECEICKCRFATVKTLKAHLIQHEGDGTGNLTFQSRPGGFKCKDCPKRFEKQAYLSAHRQIHRRNAALSNYPCMVCQRSFISARSLTAHITNKHPEVEKHKCDQCDKSFVLQAHLVEHLNRHEGNKNLVCSICEKKFSSTKSLKEHLRRHSDESPYLCPQCGKTLRSAGNLRQHMERHNGLKRYQCPECPSRFNCHSDLIKHTYTHNNTKPHVCDICGSRFTRAYSLRKHKLLHSGERPFKCDQCSMTFVIKYHWQRHLRTHTGEKPHKCKYCERTYAESGDLTKHLRTHIGENTYMCDQCPKAFKYQAELKQHQSEHYKMAQKLLLQQTQNMPEEEQQEKFVEQVYQQHP